MFTPTKFTPTSKKLVCEFHFLFHSHSLGEFITNHQLINRIQHNVVWGQKSNLMSLPTDCPQRDEVAFFFFFPLAYLLAPWLDGRCWLDCRGGDPEFRNECTLHELAQYYRWYATTTALTDFVVNILQMTKTLMAVWRTLCLRLVTPTMGHRTGTSIVKFLSDTLVLNAYL